MRKRAKARNKGPKKFAYLEREREKLERESVHEDFRQSTAIVKKSRIELPTKADAEKRTEGLKMRANVWAGEWWAIGEETLSCLNARVPEARKQSATEWLNEVFGDKWQKLRRAMVSTKALQALPIATRKQLSEGNAYLMTTKLPESLRSDPEWVKKAITLKNDEFECAVMTERARRGIVDEKEVGIWEIFRLGKLPESFKGIVSRTFEVAAAQLADQGLEIDLTTTTGRLAALETVFGDFLASYTPAEKESA